MSIPEIITPAGQDESPWSPVLPDYVLQAVVPTVVAIFLALLFAILVYRFYRRRMNTSPLTAHGEGEEGCGEEGGSGGRARFVSFPEPSS